jgi:uroporphyrinogen-III decarboxylase
MGAAMTGRQRVLKALNHEEPDRVPLDLGGTIMSGIMAHALDRLRRHLRLELRPVRVYEAFQMLGEVEMDVAERLGIDVLPVEPPVRRRIRVFAPGGGFVFNAIHNIQQETPPENVAAAYDAARTAGTYPIT